MDLRYYLRGLGVGIIVTALIMGIAASGKKETLSDSEIKERARALGMTEESTLLADAVPTTASLPEVVAAEEDAYEKEENAVVAALETEASAEPTAEASVEPTAEATPKPTPEETPVPTPEADTDTTSEEEEGSGRIITIQVNNGDGSYTVCRKLEEAGLVISASDFDMYLYENGYDKRINVGTFEIPEGADPQQIARILAGLE